MTGKSQRVNMIANHPSFGSVVSRVRGASANVPPFVRYVVMPVASSLPNGSLASILILMPR